MYQNWIVTRGKLAAFRGSWQSGLATLLFQDGTMVFCENAPTVRALDAALGGGFIAAGHTINNEAIEGFDIVYSVDEWGTLDGFTPYEDWLNGGMPEIEEGETVELKPEEFEVEEVE